jgi:hypothetical protein
MEVRLDRMLGRQVLTLNNRPIGRLEECHVEQDGDRWIVAEYEIGVAGLWDRLGLGVRLLVGLNRRRGYRVRWDQLAISDDGPLRLTCAVDELRLL